MSEIRACHCCGQIQVVEDSAQGTTFCCARCFTSLAQQQPRPWSRDPSVAFAMAALVLYFPAILLPILRIDQFGHHHASSLLGGTLELLEHGNWFVGLIVLCFSIILPFVKILGILELTLVQLSEQRHRAWVYRFVELAGRWGMMDVLLLALLVMMVKLGDMLEFQLGPAVTVFVACVACNMLASLFFNPHAVWTQERNA